MHARYGDHVGEARLVQRIAVGAVGIEKRFIPGQQRREKGRGVRREKPRTALRDKRSQLLRWQK